jgi:hypothetical protein
MTGLLEKALRRIEALSQEEQDAVASQILDTLDDEEAWARSFRENPEKLRALAPTGSGGAPPGRDSSHSVSPSRVLAVYVAHALVRAASTLVSMHGLLFLSLDGQASRRVSTRHA